MQGGAGQAAGVSEWVLTVDEAAGTVSRIERMDPQGMRTELAPEEYAGVAMAYGLPLGEKPAAAAMSAFAAYPGAYSSSAADPFDVAGAAAQETEAPPEATLASLQAAAPPAVAAYYQGYADALAALGLQGG
jgi:hypothetical protein